MSLCAGSITLMILKPKGSKEAFRALGIVGSFGFLMGGSIFGGYLIGDFLDKRFNTTPWFVIIFVLMGVVAGFLEFFKTLKRLTKEK